MSLSRIEKSWLAAYREAVVKVRPGAVVHLSIFGSKARGDSGPDSDLDVLLIVKDDAAGLTRELRRVGYLLAATGETVPSILVYTETEWENRGRTGSRFRRNVERDEVRVL
jgi:predicted nucleotidyltransferase